MFTYYTFGNQQIDKGRESGILENWRIEINVTIISYKLTFFRKVSLQVMTTIANKNSWNY